VRFIATELVRQLGFAERTRIHYGDSAQGWPGDVPQSRMDSTRLKAAGFSLPRDSDEAVRFAISAILRWLAGREAPGDDLQLPADASPALRERNPD
jgi:hypothetical protein